MPTYTVITPVRNGGKKTIPPGGTIDLTEDEARSLVAINAIELAPRQAAAKPVGGSIGVRTEPVKLDISPANEPLTETQLKKLNLAKLTAVATGEGVTVAGGDTKAAILAAILKARADKVASPEGDAPADEAATPSDGDEPAGDAETPPEDAAS